MNTANPNDIGVLIDLDGTLVDSAADIHCAVNLALQDMAKPELSLALVKSFIGRGVGYLLEQVCTVRKFREEAQRSSLRQHFMQHYAQVNGQRSQVYAGVLQGLAALRKSGYRLACVTNKPQALATDLLHATGLAEYFELIVGAESGRKLKPDPAPLLLAAELMGVHPGACVMVGDSEIDLSAAIVADMPFYLVDYGYRLSPDSWQPDAMKSTLIHSLEQLPDLLNKHDRTGVSII